MSVETQPIQGKEAQKGTEGCQRDEPEGGIKAGRQDIVDTHLKMILSLGGGRAG